jgi:hypothetical protein
LPKEFETFEVNYNSMNEKLTEKFMVMCVQEEERIKRAMVVLTVSTWPNTTRRRETLCLSLLPRMKKRGREWPGLQLKRTNASGALREDTIKRTVLSS